MKLLGFMHHKLRENSKEPLKDVKIGNNCFCLSAQSASCRKPNEPRESFFSGFKPKDIEENFEDKNISELFHGFLTIGTLGSKPATDEPATPKFGMSLENTTKEIIEVTAIDFKLVNDELEKFLEAEVEKGSNESSGINNHTNCITCRIKPIEGENDRTTGFPLQDYVFGSSIELLETKTGPEKEKALLRESFQGTKTQDQYSKEKCGHREMQTNPIHKRAKNLYKKIMKKLHISSRSSASRGENDLASTKEKFQKIVQIFHRKVHPENSTAEREINNSHMLQIQSTSSNGIDNSCDQICADSSGKMFPVGLNSNEGINKKRPKNELKGSISSGNRGYWIKTDSEYLVLEL